MGFKEMVEADNKRVFLNTDEFAELRFIRYGGRIYEDVPLVLENLKESDRTVIQSDHMRGIFRVSAKAYFSADSLGGVVPKKGQYFEVNDGMALGKPFFMRYKIVTTSCEMGMICLELEMLDE